MTMLDILKARLPDGLTITGVKERSSKHLVQFAYKGENLSGQGELVKTCGPGKEHLVCDTPIHVAVSCPHLCVVYVLNFLAIVTV